MSSSPMPGRYPTAPSLPGPGHFPGTPHLIPTPAATTEDLNRVSGPASNPNSSLGLRRRTSIQQGQGLEVLGHAIEYLIDSRMFMIDQPPSRGDSEAIHLLMLQSRQIFSECVEAVPPAERLRLWISSQLGTSTH